MIRARIFLGLTDFHGCELNAERVATCVRAVASAWPCFTRYDASGYWQGTAERSLVFERYAPDCEAERATALRLARVLRLLAKQSAIGLAIEPATFELVER